MRILPLVIILILSSATSASAQYVWRQVTGLHGGFAQGLVASRSGALFVASLRDVYRSTDGGRSWNSCAGDLDSVRYARITPLLDGTLLLAVPNRAKTGYRSTDEGRTWHMVDGILGAITIDSASGDVYVASGNSIRRSTDKGVTWDTVVSRSGAGQLYAVDDDLYRSNGSTLERLDGENGFEPVRIPWPALPPSTRFESFVMRGRELLATLRIDSELRLFRTADSGSTWTALDESRSVGRISLAPDATIYGHANPLVRSTDGGASWTELGSYDSSMVVSSIVRTAQGSLVMSSNIGIDRSDDDGESWSPSDSGFFAHTVEALAADRRGSIFAVLTGTNSIFGLFNSVSTDGGITWRARMSNPPHYQTRHPLVFDDDGTLYQAGNQGLYRSDDLGRSWTLLGPLKGESYLRLATKGDTLVGLNWLFGVYYSVDRGTLWQTLAKPTMASNVYSAIAFTRDGDLLFSRDTNHWRTSDLGATWRRTELDVRSGAFQRSIDKDIYMVSLDGLLRSKDGVTNWRRIHDLANVVTFSAASMGHRELLQLNDSLVLSEDDGITWRPVNNGIKGHKLTVIVSDADGRLYAGTAGGGLFILDVDPGLTAPLEPNASPASSIRVTATSDDDNVRIHWNCDDDNALIAIVDMRGTVIREEATPHSRGVWHFSMSSLASGAYFIEVRCAGAVGYAPIVVRR